MNRTKLEREVRAIPVELRQLFRAVREMNTFVCEACHDEELRAHPVLGTAWTPEWYLAMASLANENGWVTVHPPEGRRQWFFHEFQVLGPRCARR